MVVMKHGGRGEWKGGEMGSQGREKFAPIAQGIDYPESADI